MAVSRGSRLQEYLMANPMYSMGSSVSKAGTSTEPVHSTIEGIARALQGGIGGLMQGYAMGEAKASRKKDTESALALLSNKDPTKEAELLAAAGDHPDIVPLLARREEQREKLAAAMEARQQQVESRKDMIRLTADLRAPHVGHQDPMLAATAQDWVRQQTENRAAARADADRSAVMKALGLGSDAPAATPTAAPVAPGAAPPPAAPPAATRPEGDGNIPMRLGAVTPQGADTPPPATADNRVPYQGHMVRKDLLDNFNALAGHSKIPVQVVTHAREVMINDAIKSATKDSWKYPGDSPRAISLNMIGAGNKDPMGAGTSQDYRIAAAEATPEAFKEVVADSNVLKSAINNYKSVLEEQGGGSLAAYLNNPRSPEAQKMHGAYNSLIIALRGKGFANTGVLQPAEMDMLEKMLLAPTTIRGMLATPEAMNAKLDEFTRYVNSKLDTHYAAHNILQPGGSQSTQPRVASPPVAAPPPTGVRKYNPAPGGTQAGGVPSADAIAAEIARRKEKK